MGLGYKTFEYLEKEFILKELWKCLKVKGLGR